MNKFLKFILPSFINYNLIFSRCCKNKTEKENEIEITGERKKGGCVKSCKGKDNDDTSEKEISNDGNDNGNDNGNSNDNNKKINDFSNIRETLLTDLQNIIEINKYLKNGSKDENLLKNEINGIDSPDKANILSTKLNKLKTESLNNLKKQYQETLLNINNNLSLLKNSGNFDIDKIDINVKNDDIENLKFENINGINGKIINISNAYKEFIIKIINSLNDKYNELKPKDTNNILDVNDEEFNNLENNENKIEKIISINNRLKTAEQVIKGDVEGMKKDIRELFSELEPIKEKINKIVKDANSIFNLSINIEDKLNDNINDLKNIKTNLDNLKTEFYSILNERKIELDNRCNIINDVIKNIKGEFKDEFESVKVDEYTKDNFENIDEIVEDTEKNIRHFIDNKVKELNEKEENLKNEFKKRKLTYKDINITKNTNPINEYWNYLKEYNKELDYRNCKIEFYVNIDEPKKNNYNFSVIINKFKKLIYSYPEKCYNRPNISFTIDKENYFQKFIEEFKTYENGFTYYLDKRGKISNYFTSICKNVSLKDYDICFIYNDSIKNPKGTNIPEDAGGLRKTIFKNIKDDILNNNSLFKIKTELAPLNTVPKQKEHGPRENCTSTYYEFNNESNESNEYTELCYKILGYICAASLRSNKNPCSVNLKLNPLIYKIILKYKDINKDTKETLDEKKEKLKDILTYEDFKYFDSTYSIYFYKLQTDTLGEYKILFEKDCIDQIRNRYNEMIDNFANQIDNIKVFVKNLLKYLDCTIFEKCGQDYIKLKLLIEGEDEITSEDLCSKILEFKYIPEKNLCLSAYSKYNLELIYKLIIEVLKNFTKDDLKKFVIFVTGSDSLPINKSSIEFSFSTSPTSYGFKSHTCFNRLEINPQKLVEGIFKGYLRKDKIGNNLEEDLKEQIEKYLKESIYSVNHTVLDNW